MTNVIPLPVIQEDHVINLARVLSRRALNAADRPPPPIQPSSSAELNTGWWMTPEHAGRWRIQWKEHLSDLSPSALIPRGFSLRHRWATFAPSILPVDTSHIFCSSTQVRAAFQGQGRCTSEPKWKQLLSGRGVGEIETDWHDSPWILCIQWRRDQWEESRLVVVISGLHSPRHFILCLLLLLGTMLAARQHPVASCFALWCFRKFLPKAGQDKNMLSTEAYIAVFISFNCLNHNFSCTSPPCGKQELFLLFVYVFDAKDG